MIWYKDQILKNFTLEAMTIELNALKKHVIESEERRERESHIRNLPLIGFRKPEDRKAGDAEKAVDGRVPSRLRPTALRVPRKSPRKRLRVQVDDKNRLDGKEMPARLLIYPC